MQKWGDEVEALRDVDPTRGYPGIGTECLPDQGQSKETWVPTQRVSR